ncbi:MAG: ribonuclease P protein component [Alphaproteobacteria bacterium TMED150]|nr:ribonuclease P protein component [Paracoccaceae bacterium]RPH13598.1 MAG: ribonuclease P protein component [Alphaproteobacteria bacterium TMED150]HCJ62362.1 ribonuclease P protein component [Alphaproteobacteria bacterium]
MIKAPETLTKRSDFVKLNKGGKHVRAAFVIRFDRNDIGWPRIGITASKKIGNAVARNRAKRRLRAAIRACHPKLMGKAIDINIIARTNILDIAHADLIQDLTACFDLIGGESA